MANKRMFSSQVLDTDEFSDLPFSSQALYIQLNLQADDDGFVANIKKIAKSIGADMSDLDALHDAGYLIKFENVSVITHWRIHNTISKNTYHETQYQEEKAALFIKDNGAYSLIEGAEIDDSKLVEAEEKRKNKRKNAVFEDERTDNAQVTQEQRTDNAQVTHLDKTSLDKTSLDKNRLDKTRLDNTLVKDLINYQAIVDAFNSTCQSLPKVKTLSKERKAKIKLRLANFSEADLQTAFDKINKSNFAKSASWCSFDWIIKSDGNLTKILEGNYDNKDSPPTTRSGTFSSFEEFQKAALGKG